MRPKKDRKKLAEQTESVQAAAGMPPPKTRPPSRVASHGDETSTKPKARAVTLPTKKAPAKRKRREQQRAIDTKLTILEAALSEFAEKGFDGASTRDIGNRAGMQHPLITYHYRTKEILWRTVVEHFNSEIREAWDARIPSASSLSPRERVREEFRALLDVQMKYPDFHHFMLRENRPGSPRLPWMAETILAPIVNRVLPQIRLAQEDNELPKGEPILVYYMMIGMVSVLSSLGAEMAAVTGISVTEPAVVDAYFDLIERVMFRGSFDEAPAKSGPRQRKR